jgi:hypothetical protein
VRFGLFYGRVIACLPACLPACLCSVIDDVMMDDRWCDGVMVCDGV